MTYSHEKPRYFLKRPSKSHKTFSIVGYTGPDKARNYFTVKAPEIKAINEQFKNGTITPETAEKMLKDFMAQLYEQQGSKKHAIRKGEIVPENEKLLLAYWEARYRRNSLVDPDSHWHDLVRSVKYVGTLSLMTASFEEIEDALLANSGSVGRARRATDRLNELLKWAGRVTKEHKLTKPKDDRPDDVRHLTKVDLFELLAAIGPGPEYDLILVLFGTGVRLGEAMAIRASAIRGQLLYIDRQVAVERKIKGPTLGTSKPNGGPTLGTNKPDIEPKKRKKVIKKPKREKSGDVVVISFAIEALHRWAAYEQKDAIRQRIYKSLKYWCPKLWPSQPEKWISPHDLRHSHAIYCLSKGATLEWVALNLRNRIEVCQEYYTGFAHNEASKNAMAALLTDD